MIAALQRAMDFWNLCATIALWGFYACASLVLVAMWRGLMMRGKR